MPTKPWAPIADYEVAPADLASKTLPNLTRIWREQAKTLQDAEGLNQFNIKLQREWAIETGLIERLYTLDRGVTQLLIEKGLDASLISHGSTDQDPEKVVSMIRDHQEAIEDLFQFVKGRRHLTVFYVKELHQLLTRNQETTTAIDGLGKRVEVQLLRGDFKKRANNPRREDGSFHEYCPPEHVQSEMDHLMALHLQHDADGVAPEVEAAWLHHRFAQIHPFQDGNGRVARCLATLVFLRAGWFPLVVRDLDRSLYINALESADDGDLRPLVKLFSEIQTKAFVNALGISSEVMREQRAEQVIASVSKFLKHKAQNQKDEMVFVLKTGEMLLDKASKRFGELSVKLSNELGAVLPQTHFYSDCESFGGERSHYYRFQVIETAKMLDYFADIRNHHAWAKMALKTGPQMEILLSIHGTGPEFRGILVCSICSFIKDENDPGSGIGDLQPLCDELFQFNYLDDQNSVLTRFQEWLESAVVEGLSRWQKLVL